MAKIYGALEVAQLEWFTDAGKPAPASYIYRVIYVSDLKQVQVSDGTNWIAFLNTSTNQTLAGDITFTGAQIFSGQHRLSVTTNSSTGAIVALAATTPVIEFTGAVTSIAGIASGASGATVMLVNRSGNSFQILDEGSGASASNRIRTGAGSITLANNASVLLTYVGDNRWHVVGGSGSGAGAGGSKNYFTISSANANFAQNTVSPWSAATLTLSGGVPTGTPTLTATQMAIAATATNPLLTSESLYNMQLTKSAANAQGQGFISSVLTIDREDVAKVLTGTFNYEVVSGTIDLSGASTQSLEIWVYNVTANQWIQPAGFRGMNQSSGVGQVTFTFQTDGTPANVQYRVAVITAQTSTSAYVVNFNDFRIGPQTAPIGPVVTDLVSFTGSWQASTTNPAIGNGTIRAWVGRSGDLAKIRYQIVPGSTTTFGSGDYFVTFPSGLTIDTNKCGPLTNGTQIFGSAYVIRAGVTRYFGVVAPYFTSTDRVSVKFQETVSGVNPVRVASNSAWSPTVPATLQNGDEVFLEFEVPISGWSSNVQTSNDTDTRVVAFKGSNVGTSIAAGSQDTPKIIIPGVIRDTHGTYNVSTGAYTIPVSGFYRIIHRNLLLVPNGNDFRIGYSINTTTAFFRAAYLRNTGGVTLDVNPNCSGVEYLNAGDVVYFGGAHSSGSAISLTNDGRFQEYSIERLSGPSVIAASETVACYYDSGGAQVNIPNNVITTCTVFTNRIFDTHSAFSAGGTFTAPISGTYSVSTGFQYGINATGLRAVYTQGPSTTSILGYIAPSASVANMCNGSTLIKLNAGQTILIRTFQNSGGLLANSTDSAANFVSIVRVGN